MEEKRYIKMSLGTAVCLIIIIILLVALIALGIYTYTTKNTNAEENYANNNINYVNEDNTEEYSKEETEIANTTENRAETENEKIEKLDVTDNLSKSLIEKISFNTYATASIYNLGEFNTNNIPNDLVLRLGWDKAKNKATLNETLKQTLTKDAMKQSITNIFGDKLSYEDEDFKQIDVETFHDYGGYTDNMGMIKYNDGTYTANLFQGGGGDVPFIHQEIEKVEKNGDKVELYVKTAFIDTEYIESTLDFEYVIYKNFNFNTNTFEGKLSKINSEEYGNHEVGISENSKQVISNVSNSLNTYVYTFEKDDAGNYNFTEFKMN